jgi:L-ribulose-5-phosphate 4-epimerase
MHPHVTLSPRTRQVRQFVGAKPVKSRLSQERLIMLKSLRERVYRANMALPQYQLVTWTSGNASARDPDTGLIVIKPSGLMFEELTPENMVVVDPDCRLVEGDLGPSSDTASARLRLPPPSRRHGRGPHPLELRHRVRRRGPQHPGRAHRHRRRVRLRDPLRPLRPHRRPADRPGDRRAHRPVPGGADASARRVHDRRSVEKALKAAVMVEDIAKTVWLALQIGEVEELPAAEIAANFDRYQNRYGTAEASRG